MDELTALKNCALFFGLSGERLAAEILPRGRRREIAKGQFLLVPQDRVEEIGVVVTGKLHLLHISADGCEHLMNVLGPAKILGADLICTRTQLSPYYAMAPLPSSVFFLPAELLLTPGVLSEPFRLEILNRLLRVVSHSNMKKEYRLAILSQRGLRERIITYLTMQANKRGSGTVKIPFSREELASFLCVNRSALSHELSRMEQEGLISFRKNVFTLPQWEQPDSRGSPGIWL